jgi:hypothetical protein
MKLEQYQTINLFSSKLVDSVDLENIRIVLLKDEKNVLGREGRKNLLATDKTNNVLWIADLPSDIPFSSYQTIELKNHELYALSGSFLCKIDPKTGVIIDSKFVKM